MALDIAAAVVEPVDAHDLELRRQRIDLAQEVLCGEAPLAERVRWSVGRRCEPGTGCDEVAQKARHQPGVAGIIQLELVDADQRCALQQSDRRLVAERAHESRELDERAEVLASGRRMPERGEKVRLADAESPVEVDAGRGVGALPSAEQAGLARRPPGRERADGGEGRPLRRVVTVGAIRVERRRSELARWHQVGDDFLAREGGVAVGESAHCERAKRQSSGGLGYVSNSYGHPVRERAHSRRFEWTGQASSLDRPPEAQSPRRHQ